MEGQEPITQRFLLQISKEYGSWKLPLSVPLGKDKLAPHFTGAERFEGSLGNLPLSFLVVSVFFWPWCLLSSSLNPF